MNKKTCYFFCTLTFLLIGVAVCLLTERYNEGKSQLFMEKNYQQLVRGVGLGATTKPAWCYINFDPRVDPRCTCVEWPIPGGYCYCPDHMGTVSYFSGNVEMGVKIELIK